MPYKNRADARANKRRYYLANQERLLEKQRVYEMNNAERREARVRAWVAKNPERSREIKRAWEGRNPHYIVARAAQYRARRRKATPGWFGELDEFVLLEAAELALLRRHTTGFAWHVDHAVPLTSDLVCGLHVAANLQVLPGAVNMSKKNRYWPEMP